jgi:lipopolysaccharide/colanic/teichoic acid biosynthesis glycosyltransferase/type IV secretory pathway TrbD component
MRVPQGAMTTYHGTWSDREPAFGVEAQRTTTLTVGMLAFSAIIVLASWMLWSAAGVLLVGILALAVALTATFGRRDPRIETALVVAEAEFAESVVASVRAWPWTIDAISTSESTESSPPTVASERSPARAPQAIVVTSQSFDRMTAMLPKALTDGTVIVVVDPAPDALDRDPFAPVFSIAARAYKRIIDIAISAAALVVAAPLLALASIAIKLDDGGPVFFSQLRVGRDGRPFRIHKLRTMRVGNDERQHTDYVAAMIRGEAERNNGMFKLVDDPRVTRVGRVLRRYSIDELPQLWNVLRGDMSIIGPRPSLPRETVMYDARMWQRLRVKPGLTGLAQVSGRQELDWAQQVDCDIAYWRQWRASIDLKILCKTPAAIFKKRGAA